MFYSEIDEVNVDNILLGLNIDTDQLSRLKNTYLQYGKLTHIIKQMQNLQNETLNLINDSNTQHFLHNIQCGCKKVCGTTYYLYEKDNKLFFSLISPKEWNKKKIFKGSYYYDYEETFIKN